MSEPIWIQLDNPFESYSLHQPDRLTDGHDRTTKTVWS